MDAVLDGATPPASADVAAGQLAPAAAATVAPAAMAATAAPVAGSCEASMSNTKATFMITTCHECHAATLDPQKHSYKTTHEPTRAKYNR
jgi:cytochrome c553